MEHLWSLHGAVIVAIAVVVVSLQVMAFVTTLRLARQLRDLFVVGDLDIVPAAGATGLVSDTDQRLSAMSVVRGGLTVRFRLQARARRGTSAHGLIVRTNDVICVPDDVDGHMRSCATVATACSDLYEGRATVLASVPIYLGLAGTFGGIIAGLSQLRAISEEAIPPFLLGVLVAMVCSFAGVLLMVVMNAIVLPRVRIGRDRAMAEYLGLVRGKLVDAVAEAIDGLPHAGKPALVAAVDDLSYAMLGFKESLGPQKEMLEALKALQLPEVVKFNANLIERTDTLVQRFDKFETAVQTMTGALNSSMTLVTGLTLLMDRISVFETSLNALGEKLAVDQTLTARSIKWVEAELNRIQQASRIVQEFAAEQESLLKNVLPHFNEAFRTVTDQASQTLVEVGERLAKSVEQSIDATRVETLFDHVSSLPTIAENLRAAAERDAAVRSEDKLFRQELKAALDQVSAAAETMAASSNRVATAADELRDARWLSAVLRRLGWDANRSGSRGSPMSPRSN